MILPLWTTENILLTVSLALTAVFMGLSEHLNLFSLGYSKFHTGRGVPSRVGMLTLYSVPALAGLAAALPGMASESLPQRLLWVLVVGHFAKRALEAAFLHRYSGSMQVFSAFAIGTYYSLIAAGLVWLRLSAVYAPDLWMWLGVGLFAIGEAANGYHHLLLARLRQNKAGYHIPQGGWFAYVVCPHYFFELVAWLGIVLVSRHLFAGLVLLAMTGYLAARSLKTLAWYRQKFTHFPKNRKAIFPFLF